MNIEITGEELYQALTEWVRRRGVPEHIIIDLHFKAGRKGNPSTAYLELSSEVTDEALAEDPPEQKYASEAEVEDQPTAADLAEAEYQEELQQQETAADTDAAVTQEPEVLEEPVPTPTENESPLFPAADTAQETAQTTPSKRKLFGED